MKRRPRFAPAVLPWADGSPLLLAGSFQAAADVLCPISREHLCLGGLAVTFHYFDLFGAPLFRGLPRRRR